jgi:hypothetical protein
LEELAREEAMMTTAKNALEELSSDADAQRLARERETAVVVYRHLIGASLEEGEAKGLRVATRTVCSILDIEIDAERSARLEKLDAAQLTELVRRLEIERRWPEEI